MNSDRANITDAPSLNGFLVLDESGVRFMHYVRGGAPDGEGENSDAGSGGEGEGGDGGDSSNDNDTNQNSTEGEGSDGKTFTQEEVNKLIAKEVSKASRGKLDPKELGFETGKELKEKLDEIGKKEEEAKTEADKALEEAIEEARKEATESVLTKANARVIKSEFKVLAHDAGIPTERLEDAFALAQIQENWKDVAVDDQDTVSGLDETFFEELKEAKPYLFATEEDEGGTGDAGAAARSNKGGKKDRKEELKQKFPALQRQ